MRARNRFSVDGGEYVSHLDASRGGRASLVDPGHENSRVLGRPEVDAELRREPQHLDPDIAPAHALPEKRAGVVRGFPALRRCDSGEPDRREARKNDVKLPFTRWSSIHGLLTSVFVGISEGASETGCGSQPFRLPSRQLSQIEHELHVVGAAELEDGLELARQRPELLELRLKLPVLVAKLADARRGPRALVPLPEVTLGQEGPEECGPGPRDRRAAAATTAPGAGVHFRENSPGEIEGRLLARELPQEPRHVLVVHSAHRRPPFQ